VGIDTARGDGEVQFAYWLQARSHTRALYDKVAVECGCRILADLGINRSRPCNRRIEMPTVSCSTDFLSGCS
jgi:hypothetical protein